MAGPAQAAITVVGAHPDDIEIMALPEIAGGLAGRCRLHAVVCCDGAPADGDPAVVETRRAEALAAAEVGGFRITMLARPSAAVRGAGGRELADELRALLAADEPEAVLTHAPTDRHPTHVAVCAAVVRALCGLSPERRPARVLGCEVWGGLDWLGTDAVARDVSELRDLSDRLLAFHESQLGARRYDRGAWGRAVANAVFDDPQGDHDAAARVLAMDLTPAIREGGPGLGTLATEAIERHRARVEAALGPYSDGG